MKRSELVTDIDEVQGEREDARPAPAGLRAEPGRRLRGALVGGRRLRRSARARSRRKVRGRRGQRRRDREDGARGLRRGARRTRARTAAPPRTRCAPGASRAKRAGRRSSTASRALLATENLAHLRQPALRLREVRHRPRPDQPQLQDALRAQRPADPGLPTRSSATRALHRPDAAVPPVLLPRLRPADRERDRDRGRSRCSRTWRSSGKNRDQCSIFTELRRRRLRQEAMRRAREIVPVLRERAQKCEDARVLLPREREAAARDRPVPLPPAEALRRHGAALRRGGRHRRRARARLPLDRVERRQPRLPPLDPRLLRARDAARGVGRESRCADRLLDRACGRARPEGRRRLHGQRHAGRSPPASTTRDWNMLAVTVYEDEARPPVDWRLCLVPKSDYEIIDTWYAMGMVGHRQQGHRGEGGVRAGAARARAAPLPRRPGASRARSSTRARSSASRSSPPPAIRSRATALGAAEGAYEHVVAVIPQADRDLHRREGGRLPGRADQDRHGARC